MVEGGGNTSLTRGIKMQGGGGESNYYGDCR